MELLYQTMAAISIRLDILTLVYKLTARAASPLINPTARFINFNIALRNLACYIYGNSPEFIQAVESIRGVTYFVSMPKDTLCWMQNPVILQKQYRHKGELKTKQILKTPEKEPITLETFAKNLNNFFWYRRKVSEGTKGPIEYEFTKRRIILSKNGLPDREVWLLIRRTMDKEPTYAFFISNAPLSSRLKHFVWLSGIRWAIEQCFEEGKTELGMDHYEVRKFPGWVHHIMTCMLAHFFFWHIKIRLGEKSTSHYSVAV